MAVNMVKGRAKVKSIKNYSKRSFLNIEDSEFSNAYVSCKVHKNEFSIKLVSCIEQATIHQELESVKCRKNAIYKLSKLIEDIDLLRQHLI